MISYLRTVLLSTQRCRIFTGATGKTEPADAPSILRPYGIVFICFSSLSIRPSTAGCSLIVRVTSDRRLSSSLLYFTFTGIHMQRFLAVSPIFRGRIFRFHQPYNLVSDVFGYNGGYPCSILCRIYGYVFHWFGDHPIGRFDIFDSHISDRISVWFTNCFTWLLLRLVEIAATMLPLRTLCQLETKWSTRSTAL